MRGSCASSASDADTGGGIKNWFDLEGEEDLSIRQPSSGSSSETSAVQRAVVPIANIIEVPMEACWLYPRWLHVWVPYGPVFASGTYELVDNMAHNSFPIWKKPGSATSTACWLYSTPQQHWVVGGRRGEEGLDHGFAWLYSPTKHQGLAPNKAPRVWQHNQPEWTADRGIKITEVAEEPLPQVQVDMVEQLHGQSSLRAAAGAFAGADMPITIAAPAVQLLPMDDIHSCLAPEVRRDEFAGQPCGVF